MKPPKQPRYKRNVPVRHLRDGFEMVVRAKPDAKELGGALRTLRVTAGVTVTDMADRLGMAHQNLSRIEHGKKEPMLTTLNRYLRTLGLELVLTARPKPRLKSPTPSEEPEGVDEE